MHVLVCPTAFKGSIGAAEAAGAMARGVGRALPGASVRRLPLSDGGPGLLDALQAAAGGGPAVPPVEEVPVPGPLGEPARARILWLDGRLPGAVAPPGRSAGEGTGAEGAGGTARAEGDAASDAGAAWTVSGPGSRETTAGDTARDVAVLESADACGLHLVPRGREDALRAHTAGVGELMRAALERGAGRLVVGLGGSATTDGGTGMARAFGYRFLDGEGHELPPGGGGLARLGRIVPGRAPSVPVTALADVRTPLNGARGAARAFGPQKGATEEELEELVAGLERLSARLEADLGRGDAAELPGSGAAGGLGAGLAAFLGAGIAPGADWVLEATGFGAALAEADLVVTGEGAFDATSREGKVVGRVLDRARGAGVAVLLLCGRLDDGAVRAPAGPPEEGAGGGSGDGDAGPPALRAADGGGDRLDAGDLEELAAREAAALAG